MTRPGMLITGAPRSGTTFVGRMLALPRSVGYLDEPFNVQIGMTWVPRQFVSATPTDDNPALDRAVAQLLAGHARFRQTPFYIGTSLAARLGRRFVGSRAQLRYRVAALEPWVRRWLIKDPIACFVAERLHVRFGMPVVIVVRHPAAVVASYLRLGWRFSVVDLPHVPPVPAGADADDAVGEGARLWSATYGHLADVAARHPGVRAVRLEDLSLAPRARFLDLYDALDLRWTSRIERAVLSYTASGNPIRVDATHELRRNSRSLATSWHHELTDRQVAVVRAVSESVADQWYDDASWTRS